MNHTTILLAGTPNSGKSSLFNLLTKSRQKVANFPGVTVEKRSGTYFNQKTNTKLEVIDLPGTYSLDPISIDEQICLDRLKSPATNHINEIIFAVVDSTNLERTLNLVLQLKAIAKPIVLVLNMEDLVLKHNIKIDIKKISRYLSVPVVTTSAIHKEGIKNLVTFLEKLKDNLPKVEDTNNFLELNTSELRFNFIDKVLSECVKVPTQKDLLTHKIDKFLLHPILGLLLFILAILFMFQAVFSWSSYPMDLIESTIASIGEIVTNLIPDGFLQSLMVDGIITGVGAVLVFLPQILILFFFIYLFEASGYMARAALIMDRFMMMIGLQGRSFVPLLSSFACAIPGIMATRTIRDSKERLATIFMSPFMTCSARLPVYILLIGAFIPNTKVLGLFNLQGIVMFLLFAIGVLGAVIVAFVLRKSTLKGRASSFIMELPSYKLPNIKLLFLHLYQRALLFVKKAGTFILFVSIALWFLSTFPQPPENWDEPAINYSIAGRVGHFIEPVFRPLGFDWRISTGLIPGFAAREVMVSALATVFAVEAADANEVVDEEESTRIALTQKIQNAWTIPTGLALLMWYVFAPQCLATFAVARKETHGWKWPIIMFVSMLIIAYFTAFLTYQLGTLFF